MLLQLVVAVIVRIVELLSSHRLLHTSHIHSNTIPVTGPAELPFLSPDFLERLGEEESLASKLLRRQSTILECGQCEIRIAAIPTIDE